VNLNTATQTRLEARQGIGPAAQRISEYRQKNGSFKKIEEILEISRSCTDLLNVLDFAHLRSVAGSRRKSQ